LLKVLQVVQRQRLLTDRLRRLQRPAAPKHTQARKEAAQVGREQPITPLDRRPQRPMPLTRVPLAADQQVEAALQLLKHLRGRQDLCARRRQLYRQWDAFQPAAQFGDGSRVPLCYLEIRLHCLRPVYEQGDAWILLEEGWIGMAPR